MDAAEVIKLRFQRITETNSKSGAQHARAETDGPEPPDNMSERLTKLETQMEGVKDALKDLKSELRSIHSDVKSDINNGRSDANTNMRWMIGLGLTGSGIVIGLLVRVLTMLPHA